MIHKPSETLGNVIGKCLERSHFIKVAGLLSRILMFPKNQSMHFSEEVWQNVCFESFERFQEKCI